MDIRFNMHAFQHAATDLVQMLPCNKAAGSYCLDQVENTAVDRTLGFFSSTF